MNCKNCNKQVSENSNYCPNCGEKIENKTISKKKSSEKSNIIPIYILTFAGIIAAIIVYLILDSNNTQQISHQQTDNNTEIQSTEQNQILSKIENLKNQLAENNDNVHLNIELANNLFDVNRFDEAIPYYRKALDVHPENVNVRIDLAVAYFNLQIVDTALVEIKKALNIEPHHQQGLYNIGVMYYNTGDKEKAKENWNKLIDLHAGSEAANTAKQLLEQL